MNISDALKLKPFTLVKPKRRLFGFRRDTFSILTNGAHFGDLNDEELAEQTVGLLNSAYVMGVSSGFAYSSASRLVKGETTDYRPYTIQPYWGDDEDFEYAIQFEETDIRLFGGVEARVLQKVIDALNVSYQAGWKLGCEVGVEKPYDMSTIEQGL